MRFALGLVAVATLGNVQCAVAETWPARPIHLIVPQAAGGAPDIIARILGDRLGAALGQPIIVENRPGGGNTIGAQIAARSPSDGYTFLFAPGATLVTNPYTFKNLPYDPITDFEPVGMVAKGPFMLLAHPSIPVRNLPELFAFDRQHPHTLSVAVDNPKLFSGMLAVWLNKLGNGSILPVSYASMPQGIQDALIGRVQLIILALPAAAQYIDSGALRPIAVSWAKRVPTYPNVPAIAETFPGVDISGWFVVVAPRKTPSPIVQRMNREMDRILKDPGVAAKLATLGFFSDGALSPSEVRDFVRSEYESWGKIIRAAGIESD